MFTDEGFEDALASFPGVWTMATTRAPCADEAFAAALGSFCTEVVAAGEAGDVA